MNNWIKLTERLPKRGEKVLVCFERIQNILIGRRMNDSDDKDVWTVYFSDGEQANHGEYAETISHWMPLPEMPQSL